MPSSVALIFIFNHRYDKNIDVLEAMYKHRFSNIYHLVPFYDGDKKNVIPVYESSQHFQGYIAQGLKSYFDEKYEHYFFLGDDLILNAAINEDNYKEHFQLSSDASFIPEIFNLHNLTNNNTLRFLPVNLLHNNTNNKWYWCKIGECIKTYKHKMFGVENNNEMPTYQEAEKILSDRGYAIKPCNYYDMYGGIFPVNSATVKFAKHSTSFFKTFKLPYPLVGSYSDIVIVSKSTIKKFCHYCGVFATNRLFVEFAIPTALLLASNKVVTELNINKRGKIYWLYTKEEVENYEADMKPYNNNIKQLLANFPEERLYIHPIKLSKWKTELA